MRVQVGLISQQQQQQQGVCIVEGDERAVPQSFPGVTRWHVATHEKMTFAQHRQVGGRPSQQQSDMHVGGGTAFTSLLVKCSLLASAPLTALSLSRTSVVACPSIYPLPSGNSGGSRSSSSRTTAIILPAALLPNVPAHNCLPSIPRATHPTLSQ